MTVYTVGLPFSRKDAVAPVNDDRVSLGATDARNPRAGVENIALHVWRMSDGMSYASGHAGESGMVD